MIRIQINAKSAGQKTKLSNVRRVVSPQPRPTVAISFNKTMAGSQEPPASYMPHIAAGSAQKIRDNSGCIGLRRSGLGNGRLFM